MENITASLIIEKYEECFKTPTGKCSMRCEDCILNVTKDEVIEALEKAREVLNEDKGLTGSQNLVQGE